MEVLNSVDPYVSVSLPQRWKIRGVLVMPGLLYLFHSTFTSVWFVFLLFPFFLFLYDDTPFIIFLNFTPLVHIFSLNYSKLNINFIKMTLNFFYFYYYDAFGCSGYMYVCIISVPHSHGGQKRGMPPPENGDCFQWLHVQNHNWILWENIQWWP